MDKVYYEGHWFMSLSLDSICYAEPHYAEPCTQLDEKHIKHIIGRRDIHSLVEFLEHEGFIKPRLDERLRTEDLKITHRLLDLLERR